MQEISEKDGEVLVRLSVGEAALLAQVTLRSARLLELEPGMRVFAVVKSVAVAPGTAGAGTVV